MALRTYTTADAVSNYAWELDHYEFDYSGRHIERIVRLIRDMKVTSAGTLAKDMKANVTTVTNPLADGVTHTGTWSQASVADRREVDNTGTVI